MRLILYLQSWWFSVILAVYSSKINFVSAKTSHKSENDKLDNDKSDNAHAMPPKVQLATNRLVRYAFFVLGGFFALLALIGVILPGLPTTPFLLLATGCFAKSSPKFHHWLITHKTFGSLIVNWQERRVIPRRAKYLAWTMMTISCVMLFWRFWDKPNWLWLAIVTSVICLCTMLWMARLPSR